MENRHFLEEGARGGNLSRLSACSAIAFAIACRWPSRSVPKLRNTIRDFPYCRLRATPLGSMAFGRYELSNYNFALMGVAIVTIAALWSALRFTRFGNADSWRCSANRWFSSSTSLLWAILIL